MSARLLVFGHDTVECAYYLQREAGCTLDFERLAVEKELIKASKKRLPTPIKLGAEEFLLQPNGTGSGYPFLIENDTFSVEFGEHNKPNFFVTYRSQALWEHGIAALHRRFLAWAESMGMHPYRDESLSRVDFTFDFHVDEVDFGLDNFVSTSRSDYQHRLNRKVQTYNFGSGQLLARIYDKVAEIEAKSHKTWFYDIWGCNEGVWRIEWQVRKEMLKFYWLRTIANLQDGQAELLEYAVNNHLSLRVSTTDSNKSRWPLHPIWKQMIEYVGKMEKSLPDGHELNHAAYIEDRLMRISISVYGYMKRFAAIRGLQMSSPEVGFDEAFDFLRSRLRRVHDDFDWDVGVQRRYNEMRLGQ